MAKNTFILTFSETFYQKIAKEFGASISLVGKIARGERKPKQKHSKGMKIKEAIDKIREEQKLKQDV